MNNDIPKTCKVSLIRIRQHPQGAHHCIVLSLRGCFLILIVAGSWPPSSFQSVVGDWQGLSLRWLLPVSTFRGKGQKGNVTVSNHGVDDVTVSNRGVNGVTVSTKGAAIVGERSTWEANTHTGGVPSLLPDEMMDALRVLALNPEQVAACAELLQEVRQQKPADCTVCCGLYSTVCWRTHAAVSRNGAPAESEALFTLVLLYGFSLFHRNDGERKRNHTERRCRTSSRRSAASRHQLH